MSAEPQSRKSVRRRRLFVAAVVASLLLNVVLASAIAPLLPYYRAYWRMREFVSTKILRRERPDTTRVFQTADFQLAPLQARRPQFRLDDLFAAEDPDAMARSISRELAAVMGLGDLRRADPALLVHHTENFPAFTREKISYATQPGVRIPAYLLKPKNAPPPWPTVLVVHGCGYGKAGPAGVIDDLHHSFAVKLAEAGIMALVPDRRGFGELQPAATYMAPDCGAGMNDGRRILESDARAALGVDLRALDVFDLLAAVDLLADRSDVSRLGVAGLSGGGVVASLAAGQTDRISAVMLSNSVSALFDPGDEASFATPSGAYEPLPPRPAGLLKFLERHESPPRLRFLFDEPYLIPIVLVAPRPLLLQFGDSDPNYVGRGRLVVDRVAQLYQKRHSADRLSVSIRSGGHELLSDGAIDFFTAHLR